MRNAGNGSEEEEEDGKEEKDLNKILENFISLYGGTAAATWCEAQRCSGRKKIEKNESVQIRGMKESVHSKMFLSLF